MKRTAFLAAVLLALTTSLFGKGSAEAQPLGRPDWSGAYVGFSGGLGLSDGRAGLSQFAGPLLTLDVSNGLFPRGIGSWGGGGVFGLTAGVNAQSGAFVAGAEIDLAFASVRIQNSFTKVDPGPIFPGVNTNSRYETNFGAWGSMRVRAGFAFGDTLLYGTAGLAMAQIRNRLALALPELNYTSPDWTGVGFRAGYVIGAGVEHRIASNLSVKFEVLYFNFQDKVVNAADPTTFPGESFAYRYSNTMLMQRLGVNMRF